MSGLDDPFQHPRESWLPSSGSPPRAVEIKEGEQAVKTLFNEPGSKCSRFWSLAITSETAVAPAYNIGQSLRSIAHEYLQWKATVIS